MKQTSNLLIAALLLSVLTLTGCNKDDDNVNGAIEVAQLSSLEQQAFADDNAMPDKVTITTRGAWTSVTSGGQEWAILTPDHADAPGTYDLTIHLRPNYNGYDREKELRIQCGDESIIISVKQLAVQSDGAIPYGRLSDFADLPDKYASAMSKAAVIAQKYSDLDVRKALVPTDKLLTDFWMEAYEVINACNAFFDRMMSSAYIYPEDFDFTATFNQAKGMRGTLYFYLSLFFGYIPATYDVYNQWDMMEPLPFAEWMVSHVSADLQNAVKFLPESGDWPVLKHQAEWIYLINNLRDKLYVGATIVNRFNSIAGVDKIAKESRASVLLLASVVFLQGKDLAAATDLTNQALQLLGLPATTATTAEEVRQVSTDLLNSLTGEDTGARLVAMEWVSPTADWVDYRLLPIPQAAMEANKHLKQNNAWRDWSPSAK
ncbi:MAG: RagB/SusD family nutrient uptake outer membrane protein [Prevotellaceae bacterium]|jgi:hypothetical protein|nr:RagB/SusD family nutrient uptake outer membrane protein [Prevotellaceae bacterium]